MNEMRILLTSRASDKLFSDLLPTISRELTLHLNFYIFCPAQVPWIPHNSHVRKLGHKDEPATWDVTPALEPD